MAGPRFPAELAHLPLALRNAVRDQCAGEWARVTVDGRGSVTVHNRPQANGLRVRAAAKKAPARSAPSSPAPVAARAPAVPVPPPVRRAQPPLKDAPAREPVTPIPMPVFQPPPLLPAPERSRAEPARKATPPPPERQLRPASEVLGRSTSPAESQPPERAWVLLPGTEQSDFDGDLAASAWRLVRQVRTGVGDAMPLRFYDDVTALNGIDLAQVESVVRHADRVEVDPSTGWKKFPILRFHRGDNMAVVGFRDPNLPLIIAAYFNSHTAALPGRIGANMKTGGGGSRKKDGLPNTPHKLIGALRFLGCDVPDPGPSDKVVTVTYQGVDLGKVPVEEGAARKVIEGAYQRTARRIHAIKLRQEAGKAI